eukprot:TRINITY_DN67488_c0_g1_i1.p1 TRINITY_DN67488_c0_g1~~TRINITY_DN67488_c0_g1_i1.p1  ORF type:complete len:637 (+),score=106.91 TRINITY_DN67488_c0_g1_i1:143-2053(+)
MRRSRIRHTDQQSGKEDPDASIRNSSIWATVASRRYSVSEAAEACETRPLLHGDDFENQEHERDENIPMEPYATPCAITIGLQAKQSEGFCLFIKGLYFRTAIGGAIIFNVAVCAYFRFDAGRQIPPSIVGLLLGWYGAEIACRLSHRGAWAFLTEPDEWMWNCGDLAAVVAMAILWFSVGDDCVYAGAARSLQLLRYGTGMLISLRHVFRDLDWVEGNRFQSIVGIAIAVNAISMGIEIDVPSPIWWWANQSLLLFYLFEFCVRVRLHGWAHHFVKSADLTWNYLDAFVLVIGIFDCWGKRLVALFSDAGSPTSAVRVMMMMRMMRLLRILRILRLVKAFRPLYSLVIGMSRAMPTFFWVLVLTIVSIYACAILATRTIGETWCASKHEDLPPGSRCMFSSVDKSMFRLFVLMNGKQWGTIKPMLEALPFVKPVFLIFIVVSSWSLLSVLTGVVCNFMSLVGEKNEKNEEDEDEDRAAIVQSLRSVFAAADMDGMGSLCRDEYLEICRSPFHVQKLQKVARIPVHDLAAMFDLLDVNNSEECDWDEFLHGFDWLAEPISGKALLKIKHAVGVEVATLTSEVTKATSKLADFKRRQEERHDELVDALKEAIAARARLKEAEDAAAVAKKAVQAVQK